MNFVFSDFFIQAEEAAQRTMHPDKVQDLDEMLSSLGVAPVSGN